VIEAPVSAHVTRNGGAPERRHLATQVGFGSVRSERKQARFPVLFPRNVERDLVAGESRRDLKCFLKGGRCINFMSERGAPMSAVAFRPRCERVTTTMRLSVARWTLALQTLRS
jgi:hypothetical protein